MLKQFLVLIAFSMVIILSMSYAQQAIEWLLKGHDYVSQLLTDVFSEGQAGNLTRGLITLLAIPVLVSLVPAAIYWLFKRHWFPYFMEVVWAIWLIQAGALMVLY